MPTDAQIAANRTNALASTGPTTPEGKAHSSRNAISFGLYSRGDFVRPGEESEYAAFCDNFRTELRPEGAMEQTLVAEIVHAAWRLRRCSAIEASLLPGGELELDPIYDESLTRTQQALDRARTQAHRILHRTLAELRRFQTERQCRAELLPKDFDSSATGVASYKDLLQNFTGDVQRKLLHHKLANVEAVEALSQRMMEDRREIQSVLGRHRIAAAKSDLTKQTQSPAHPDPETQPSQEAPPDAASGLAARAASPETVC